MTMNKKINFMLIGAQKAGTTSLSHQLAQHPQINFCKFKEPDFFSKSLDWKTELPSYLDQYENTPGKIYGEGSTTYSWLLEYPHTAKRIKEYNPDIKLIYLMRQPVERAISHYTHHLLKARTKYPIEREIFEFPTYINHSSYALQLAPYFELFPKCQIHLMFFEEYVKSPLQSLNELADFLGIERKGFDEVDLKPQYQSLERTGDTKLKKFLTPLAKMLFPVRMRNALRGPFVYKLDKKQEVSDEFKRLLWRYFENDVAALERYLGRSLDFWRESPYNSKPFEFFKNIKISNFEATYTSS
jgi:hypothetical protein